MTRLFANCEYPGRSRKLLPLVRSTVAGIILSSRGQYPVSECSVELIASGGGSTLPIGAEGWGESLSSRTVRVNGPSPHPVSHLAMRADPRASFAPIRSAHLTNFWHCGGPSFSFRTAAERRLGNEPSRVLAEDCASQGSGNADSQPNVRSSGGSGAGRPSPDDSGCVTAHPASWRASASYRPLRAVWAVCAWALRGSREITRSLPRSTSSAPAKGISE